MRPNIQFTITNIRGNKNTTGDLLLLAGVPNKRWFVGELYISISGAVLSNLTEFQIPTGVGGTFILKANGDGTIQPFFHLKNIFLGIGRDLLLTINTINGETITVAGWAEQRG